MGRNIQHSTDSCYGSKEIDIVDFGEVYRTHLVRSSSREYKHQLRLQIKHGNRVLKKQAWHSTPFIRLHRKHLIQGHRLSGSIHSTTASSTNTPSSKTNTIGAHLRNESDDAKPFPRKVWCCHFGVTWQLSRRHLRHSPQ